jgi:hypothetical protein
MGRHVRLYTSNLRLEAVRKTSTSKYKALCYKCGPGSECTTRKRVDNFKLSCSETKYSPWWPASWTHGYLCFLYVWKNGVHWTIFRSFRQPEGCKEKINVVLLFPENIKLPRVEAGKNTSTVIPESRKRRRKGNPVVSDEVLMYGY